MFPVQRVKDPRVGQIEKNIQKLFLFIQTTYYQPEGLR